MEANIRAIFGRQRAGRSVGECKKGGPGCVVGKLTVQVFLLKIDRSCERLFLRPVEF